jgi:hypothetical protein
VVQSNTQKPIAIIASPAVICAGQSFPLNGAGSSVGANFTYKWSDVGITAGGTTLNPTINAAGNYSLSVTNTANTCVSISAVTVNQGAVPTINMVAGKIKCMPNTTTIKAINDTLTNIHLTGRVQIILIVKLLSQLLVQLEFITLRLLKMVLVAIKIV